MTRGKSVINHHCPRLHGRHHIYLFIYLLIYYSYIYMAPLSAPGFLPWESTQIYRSLDAYYFPIFKYKVEGIQSAAA